VISVEYFTVLHKKAMEKATTKVNKETHYKEREENRIKKFAIYFIINEQAFE
jgi:hypothetical protein